MPKRVDANQPVIVRALREAGCKVQHLHEVGQGCPDLLVGYQGVMFVCEIKDGSKPPSRQKLTPDELRWHEDWLDYPVFVLSQAEQIPKLLDDAMMYYVDLI